MALADIRVLVSRLVRDDAGLFAPADIDAAIDISATRISDESPAHLIADVNAPSQWIDVPPQWVAGWSRLVSVEAPIDDVPARLIDVRRVQVRRLPDGSERIGINGSWPAPVVRLTWTAMHSADTAAAHLAWPIAAWAASVLCGQAASHFANQTNSTIGADAVDHKSKSELWAARERQYRDQGYEALGIPIPSRGAVAAAAMPSPSGTVVVMPPRRSKARPAW